MLQVYPFGTGSLYTASFALTASYAATASSIAYVYTASNAGTVLYPQSGSRGKSVCLITNTEYLVLQQKKEQNYVEICNLDCTCQYLNTYYGPTITNACSLTGTINLYNNSCTSTDVIYTNTG